MTPADAAALAEIQRRSYRDAGRGLHSSWPEEDALDERRLQGFLDRTRYGSRRRAQTAVRTPRPSPSSWPAAPSGSAPSKDGGFATCEPTRGPRSS